MRPDEGEHTMPAIQKITPCLWFDAQAEEAAKFYTAIFKSSRIVSMTWYGEAGHEVHGRPAGTVMTVAFELEGQAFTGPCQLITCSDDQETRADMTASGRKP
jgi:predicted 3-demethylubiquinone-9 3-methyltransferase (glyoxalase superfamily)